MIKQPHENRAATSTKTVVRVKTTPCAAFVASFKHYMCFFYLYVNLLLLSSFYSLR